MKSKKKEKKSKITEKKELIKEVCRLLYSRHKEDNFFLFLYFRSSGDFFVTFTNNSLTFFDFIFFCFFFATRILFLFYFFANFVNATIIRQNPFLCISGTIYSFVLIIHIRKKKSIHNKNKYKKRERNLSVNKYTRLVVVDY